MYSYLAWPLTLKRKFREAMESPFQQLLHGQLRDAGGPHAESPSLPGSISLSAECVWLVRAGVLARRYRRVLELAKVVERTLVQGTMLQCDHGQKEARVVVGNTPQARIQLHQAGWSLFFLPLQIRLQFNYVPSGIQCTAAWNGPFTEPNHSECMDQKRVNS